MHGSYAFISIVYYKPTLVPGLQSWTKVATFEQVLFIPLLAQFSGKGGFPTPDVLSLQRCTLTVTHIINYADSLYSLWVCLCMVKVNTMILQST